MRWLTASKKHQGGRSYQILTMSKMPADHNGEPCKLQKLGRSAASLQDAWRRFYITEPLALVGTCCHIFLSFSDTIQDHHCIPAYTNLRQIMG
jgi:hypothetical protein